MRREISIQNRNEETNGFCCFIFLGVPFIILLTADNEERARPITRYSKELVNSAFTLFVFARNGLNKNSTT